MVDDKKQRKITKKIFTCKLHHACLYLVSVHQMALPVTCDSVRLIAAYYSSIQPEG